MTKLPLIPKYTPTDDDIEEAGCITEDKAMQACLLDDFAAQYTTGFRDGIAWTIEATCPFCMDRIRAALAVHEGIKARQIAAEIAGIGKAKVEP